MIVLAQSVPIDGGSEFDIGSWIERFGFPTVIALALAYVVYKLARVLMTQLTSDRDTWKAVAAEERKRADAATARADVASARADAAEKRADIMVSQGDIANHLLESIKETVGK